MSDLTWKNVSVRLASTIADGGGKFGLDRVSLTLKQGALVVVLGPNGAGKTTLLRAGLGFIKPVKNPNHQLNHQGIITGQCLYGDRAVTELSPIERAQSISYLPQTRPLAWPNKVRDIVALGRYAYGGAMGRLSQLDDAAVQDAMIACGLLDLAQRSADSLSGGELARVHCARAFAAKTPLLIADEPVAALDPRHQFRVMELIRGFVDDGGGALVVLHDVGLAAQYADHLVWMKEGAIKSQGSVRDTLSVETLAEIYGVAAKVDGTQVRITGAL